MWDDWVAVEVEVNWQYQEVLRKNLKGLVVNMGAEMHGVE